MEIDVLKNLIVDAQKIVSQPLVRRSLQPLVAPGKVFVCIGARRVGKSTYLTQVAMDLIEQGVPKENFLFLNFQDDRLKQVRAGQFDLIPTAYFSLFPEKRGTETVYFFFDEIQETRDWELFIERLLRTEKSQIYLTGSSARLLSREIATQMRGRSLTNELWPFSFAEYLSFRKIENRPGSKNDSLVEHAFSEYWERGGFPELREADERLRAATHQEYLRTMIYRDIIERHDAPHPQAVLRLAEKLVSSISNLYTLNRLTEFLRSLGFKVQKEFVSSVIGWLEDSFVLFSVHLWDRSLAKQNVNPKKIYMIDHAMAVSCDASFLEKRGYLLENLVFTHLRRQTNQIHYYKTRTSMEVDFRIGGDKAEQLIQVAWDLENESTMRRETKSLFQAMEEQEISRATIVTWNNDQLLESEGREIRIVPIRKFLLEKLSQW